MCIHGSRLNMYVCMLEDMRERCSVTVVLPTSLERKLREKVHRIVLFRHSLSREESIRMRSL